MWLSGGFLSQEEVLSRVRSASVGVIPNLPTPLNRFALSTKLFEYVALGVPVVAADLPTIREHFSDEEVLFFRRRRRRSLASALASLRPTRLRPRRAQEPPWSATSSTGGPPMLSAMRSSSTLAHSREVAGAQSDIRPMSPRAEFSFAHSASDGR